MVETVAAVTRNSGGPFSLETVQLEGPRADEVLVRITGVGLCHSDLLARAGILPVPLPAVFGHEGAGVVVEVGNAVPGIEVGDHVALSYWYCGECSHCERSEPSYCDQFAQVNNGGARPDGSSPISDQSGRISGYFFGQSSFAHHAVANARNVVKLPKDVPLEIMGPLGCGIQTGAGSVINVLKCHPGSSILILGGGSVGLSAMLAAVAEGCTTIMVSEPHASRRALALDLGATHVIDPTKEDVPATVRGLVPDGVDYAMDATGIPAVIAAGISCLGKRGSMAIAGVPLSMDAAVSLPILPLVGLGQTIRGVVEGDSDAQTFIPHLVELYRQGRFPLDRLITMYRLSEIEAAVRDHEQGRCVKAVLLPD